MKRRRIALSSMTVLCLLAISACARNTRLGPSEAIARFKVSLEDVIRASGAEVGYAFCDLATGTEVMINEKTLFHAASTMKAAVMIGVFKQAGQERFSLDDPLLVRNQFSRRTLKA